MLPYIDGRPRLYVLSILHCRTNSGQISRPAAGGIDTAFFFLIMFRPVRVFCPYARISGPVPYAYTYMVSPYASQYIGCPYAYGIALDSMIFLLQFTLQHNHACQPRVETASASLTWMTH